MNKRTVIKLLGLLLVLSLAAWGVRQQVVSARTEDARPLKLQATARPTLSPTETPTLAPTATPTATITPTAPPAEPAAPAATPTTPTSILLPKSGGN